MRVRAQDANGDYTIGSGSANFLADSPQFVGQMIEDYLGFFEGEWFLDLLRGLAMFQSIIGYSNSALRDMLIRSRILQTPGVTSIESYSSSFDPGTRKFTVQGTANTQFSKTPVAFGPVVI